MSPDKPAIPYPELVALADQLLEESDEDVARLATKIGALDAGMRNELLLSDLLNAFQIFYYCFRTVPDELEKERLELEPASSLETGITIQETDLLEMCFLVREAKALIVIRDGERIVASFSGSSAFAQGREFLKSPEYR
jgi:hypothetical protein